MIAGDGGAGIVEGMQAMKDDAFEADVEGLRWALDALVRTKGDAAKGALPSRLPEDGLGEIAVLEMLAPLVLGGARPLGTRDAFAHMDPPTPWITWATTLWNAALNQNLLHPDLSPAAGRIETSAIDWIAPFFGMEGGHMTPGSTVANLTALWAARELTSIRTVVASDAAHLSVAKAAHLLGLDFHALETDDEGRMTAEAIDVDLESAALVLTAGTTNAGAIDALDLAGRAAWTHVDAAWAGPLMFSHTHRSTLDGIDRADSVSVSAHKWLFQPKESGLVLFKDVAAAHPAVSFGGAYLAVPNIGVLGSHGAAAVPLLATLLAWGRTGLAERIDRAMACASDLWERLNAHPEIRVFGPQASGVILWRPAGSTDLDRFLAALPEGSTSRTTVRGEPWLRNVAANPMADIDALWASIEGLLREA